MKTEKKGNYIVITDIKLEDLVFSRDENIRIGKHVVGQYEKLGSDIYGRFTAETFRVKGNFGGTTKEVKEMLYNDLKVVNYMLVVKQ